MAPKGYQIHCSYQTLSSSVNIYEIINQYVIRFKRLWLTEPLFHYSPPPHSSS